MTDPMLHGPEFCPRVCSTCECEDGRSRHHWIEQGGDLDEPDEEIADNPVRQAVRAFDRANGTEHELGYYACKHCDAWAEAEYIWEMEDGEEDA